MWDWLGQLETLRRGRSPFAIATVVGTSGSTPRELGAKLLVQQDGRFFGTVGGGQLEQLVLRDARTVLTRGAAERFKYPLGPKAGQCCGGVMEVLIEPVGVGPRLFLFGGGHVAQALCQVLAETSFSVDLVEEREEWLHAPSLPVSVVRHAEPWEDFLSQSHWDAEKTFVAVMTHRHDLDEAILSAVLLKPTRYVGLIGSVTKWSRFKARLLEQGQTPGALDRVHCPIGLPIGGKSPKEVAISVAAELLQLFHRA